MFTIKLLKSLPAFGYMRGQTVNLDLVEKRNRTTVFRDPPFKNVELYNEDFKFIEVVDDRPSTHPDIVANRKKAEEQRTKRFAESVLADYNKAWNKLVKRVNAQHSGKIPLTAWGEVRREIQNYLRELSANEREALSELISNSDVLPEAESK